MFRISTSIGAPPSPEIPPRAPRRWWPWGAGIFLGVWALILLVLPVQAESGSQGEVLCPPVAVADRPLGCAPWGAADYVDTWAVQGVTFPLTPLPAVPLDEAWLSLPIKVHYAYVRAEKTRMYHYQGDGLEGGRPARTYPPGFVYVSYDSIAYVGRQRIYRVNAEANLWMWGKDLWPIQPSTFRGLRFAHTPSRPFGWIVANNISPRTVPGLGQPRRPETLARYTVIQVYAQRDVDGTTWYMIGPDKWVEQRWVGLVFPRQTPPEGVTSERWIEINLFEQTLAAYEHGQLIFATLVSTGAPPFWTQPGLFQIYEKHDHTNMRGAFEADRSDYYMLEDVPWTMYFDESRALHGAYWHDSFGYPSSHGCVNLSIADAHWLFEWAQVGDQVYVWDPSGQTPTDPDAYGSGGF